MKKIRNLGILLIALLPSCQTSKPFSSSDNKEPMVVDLRDEGIMYNLDLSKTVNNISIDNFNGDVISISSLGKESTQTGFTIDEDKLRLSKVCLNYLLEDRPYLEALDISINTSTNYSYIMRVSIASKVISKPYELLDISQTSENVDAYYVLANDLDLEDTQPFKLINNDIFLPVSSWNPLTYNYEIGFKGIFDGRGHTISNLTTSNKYNNLSGLFGQIAKTGVVKNVAFYNLACDKYCPMSGESSAFLGTLENVAVIMNKECQSLRFLWNILEESVLKNVVAVGFSDFAYTANENAISENVLTVIKNQPTKYINLSYNNFIDMNDMTNYIKENNVFDGNNCFHIINDELYFSNTNIMG